MRLSAAFPLALLVLASPAGALPQNGEIVLTIPKTCGPETVRRAESQGRLEARRLDRLPAGRLDLAVMREVGGCPQPVTIRENYGAVAVPRPGRR
jgi:hypothetical protein